MIDNICLTFLINIENIVAPLRGAAIRIEGDYSTNISRLRRDHQYYMLFSVMLQDQYNDRTSYCGVCEGYVLGEE
jgi:hypothetical protein